MKRVTGECKHRLVVISNILNRRQRQLAPSDLLPLNTEYKILTTVCICPRNIEYITPVIKCKHMLLSFQTFAQDSDVNTFSYSSTAKISFVCLTIVVVLLIVVFAHYKNPAKTGFVLQIAGKQLAPTNVFIGRVLSCP